MWSQRLTERFIRDGIILPENAEVVRYGLEALTDNVLAFMVTAAVGLFYGSLLSGIVLWMLVFPLRKYAGGYHAKTKVRCYLISAGMLALAYTLLYQPDFHPGIYVIIAIVSGGYIYRNAPVDNVNKMLDAVERKVYRKRARIVLGLDFFLLDVAWVLCWRDMLMVIAMCFSVVTISLVTVVHKKL